MADPPVSSDPARPTGVVLLAVRDLFFRVKLEAGLRRLGVAFRVAASVDSAASSPALVIVDLADSGLDPLELVRGLRARPDLAGVPIVGYAPHGDAALREAGRLAGCTAVVSRSRLSGSLAEVLEPFLRRRTGGA
jgi:CheY-like chemotaxis protein